MIQNIENETNYLNLIPFYCIEHSPVSSELNPPQILNAIDFWNPVFLDIITLEGIHLY